MAIKRNPILIPKLPYYIYCKYLYIEILQEGLIKNKTQIHKTWIYAIFFLVIFNWHLSMQCSMANKTQGVTGCGRIRKGTINSEREEERE